MPAPEVVKQIHAIVDDHPNCVWLVGKLNGRFALQAISKGYLPATASSGFLQVVARDLARALTEHGDRWTLIDHRGRAVERLTLGHFKSTPMPDGVRTADIAEFTLRPAPSL